MAFASAEFIMLQVFVSLVTQSLTVDCVSFHQARNRSMKQQEQQDMLTLKNLYSHPTNRKKVALMCHNKNYLVLHNHKLQGSVNPKIIKKFGKFELQSFDVGVVRIFNVREKLFIAVDKKGRAYVTRDNTIDTLFKETQKNSLFVTYHSFGHRSRLANGHRRKWYLAIKKSGKLKRPSKTLLRHRSIEFLPRDWKRYRTHLMNSR